MPVIRRMTKKVELKEDATKTAQEVVEEVDKIQTCVEHLMASPQTELVLRVQKRFRETRVNPVMQNPRKEIEETLHNRVPQSRQRGKETRTLSTITRLRNAINLQQLLKTALKVKKPIHWRPDLKRASATLPHQGASSASSSTVPSSPFDVSAAVESASGRVSRIRPSSASSLSAPTALVPRRRAKSEGSEPSEWGSSAPTLFSTGRSTPTPI